MFAAEKPPPLSKEELFAYLSDCPQADARRSGLTYVEEQAAGFRRLRWGRGFTYRDADDVTVRCSRLRRRFRALAVPPAWTEVWISSNPKAHLLASGRDSAGRKQYIYHPRFQRARSETKFRRMVAFGTLLPGLRAAVRADLERDDLSRKRVAAAVVALLDESHARVGHDEYAKKNDSYGLTTLSCEHVSRPRKDSVDLSFVGKAGRAWDLELHDAAIVSTIRDCVDLPGDRLFRYERAGELRDLTADDVNQYIGRTSGHALYAKDFRTWAGCALATRYLRRLTAESERAVEISGAVKKVAHELQNTPAVCRSSYIAPPLLEATPLRKAEAQRAHLGDRTRRPEFDFYENECLTLAVLRNRYNLSAITRDE
ncbi:MAG: DNA topoisomerase IB [Myxococcota bacterium]